MLNLIKLTVTIFILTISTNGHSFILISSDAALPDGKNVKINISYSSCSTAGITHDDLKNYIQESLDNYWNNVGSSSLFIEYGGVITSTNTPSGNTIYVRCTTEGFTKSSNCYPEATGGQNSSGESKYGIININNYLANCWQTRSHDRLLYVFAHEMGHALGLHHSKDPASIMTYEHHEWENPPTSLSQDDLDGITYLYPYDKKLEGLAGSCGTVAIINSDNSDDNNFPGTGVVAKSMILSFFLGILFIFNIKFIVPNRNLF